MNDIWIYTFKKPKRPVLYDLIKVLLKGEVSTFAISNVIKWNVIKSFEFYK